MTAGIGAKTRRLLWWSSGFECAFPDCNVPLVMIHPDGNGRTVVGIECHIVAQKNSKRVARSIPLLSPGEKERFRGLIEDRHGFENLVLMCGTHSTLIDDPAAGFDIESVLAIKKKHMELVAATRHGSKPTDEAFDDQYADIVDEWVGRVGLDEWELRYGDLFGDGHPRIAKGAFDQLTETRTWVYTRVWPDSRPELNSAFENFRRVAQDLQLTMSKYPHEYLGERGVIAIERFYNSSSWIQTVKDHHQLDQMYEWYAMFVEDLTLELVRATNLVCRAVRETIDPKFRLEAGLVSFESGPYSDWTSRRHIPQYGRADGWTPYSGIQEFLTSRGERDECRDVGGPPKGLALPGA